jgi:hypothetical protein
MRLFSSNILNGLLLVGIFFLSSLKMLHGQFSQGPLNPASFANNNTTCPFAYTSVAHIAPSGNVATSNNINASASHCDCCDTQTSCLEARNYGFTIPGTATITGIRVDVERRRSAAAGGYIEDNGVMILKGGVYSGPNKANYGVNWPTTDAYVSYGGLGDLWGTTWTPADINSAAFGVAIASISYTCGSAMTSFVDHIRMTVFYDDPLEVLCTNFYASRSSDAIQLSWNLENASNVNELWLERSESAEGFTRLASLDVQCEQFKDEIPSVNNSWYRLAWRDIDGIVSYGNALEITASEEPSFRAYLRDDQLVLTFSKPLPRAAEVHIMDAGGRRIFSSALQEGSESCTLISPISMAGFYWLNIPGMGFAKVIRSGW